MRKNGKIKIFIVDDDTMYLRSLKHILQEKWAEIKTFSNGEECLKHLKQDNPEVVVLDYYLNDKSDRVMNGVQVLNKIKKSSPETEVIVLSAQDNVTIAVDALKYGAYDYIAKGESAFFKVKNDLKHISDSRFTESGLTQKIDKIKIVNIIIIAVLLIIYILNRIL